MGDAWVPAKQAEQYGIEGWVAALLDDAPIKRIPGEIIDLTTENEDEELRDGQR